MLPDCCFDRRRRPQQAALKFVKQSPPAIADLTTAAAWAANRRLPDRRLGAGGEPRLHVPSREPANLGPEMLAARVSLVASSAEGQQVLGQGCPVTWTDGRPCRPGSTQSRWLHRQGTGSATPRLEATKRGDRTCDRRSPGRALAHEAGNGNGPAAGHVVTWSTSTRTVRLKKRWTRRRDGPRHPSTKTVGQEGLAPVATASGHDGPATISAMYAGDHRGAAHPALDQSSARGLRSGRGARTGGTAAPG